MLDKRHKFKNNYSVIVPEAHAVGAIGVIRSLGRAGYQVHGMSSDPNALGFSSNYSKQNALSPPYKSRDFLPWFRNYVKEKKINAIIPSDGLIWALWPVFEEFADLITTNSRKDIIYRCFSKYRSLEYLIKYNKSECCSDHLPLTILVDKKTKITFEDLSNLPKPIFIKVDASPSDLLKPGKIIKEIDEKKAAQIIHDLVGEYQKVVVQGNVKGKDAGVYLICWNNSVVAEFMNYSNHSVPHTGGFYSLRESFVNNRIRLDAIKRIKALSWEGVAMMEYRWEPSTGEFWFIEMNARFWGSIHHALYAGIDFPLLLLELFSGEKKVEDIRAKEYPIGLQCRYTFPMEVGYVASSLKDPNLSLKSKFLVCIEFFFLFFKKDIFSDLYFPGDKKLYFKSIKSTIRQFLKS